MHYFKQFLLASILVVVAWKGAGMLGFDDWAARIEERKTRISTLKTKNQATDRYRQERPVLLAKVAEARHDYAEVEKYLPSEPTVGAVLAKIQNDAQQLRLAVRSIEEPHPPYVLGINEIPLKLEVQGLFPDQKTLLKSLGEMQQTINLRETSLDRKDDGSAYLTINLGVLVDLPTKEAVDKANGK